jgi:carbon-monoxide dehydrogenase large subunit
VINAICHALGVKDVPMPATPYTVWKAANPVRNSAVIR